MSVGPGEVERVAALANLSLEGDELDRLTGDLNAILDHVRQLESLETDGAVAEGHADLPSTRSADDSPPDPLGRPPSEVAPAWIDGFFAVPPPPGVQAADE